MIAIKYALPLQPKIKAKVVGLELLLMYCDETIFLLSIYDKSEQGNISDKELNDLIKFIK